MTRAELVKYLQSQNCTSQPIEGINISGWQIKFVNKKNENLYAYIDMPVNGKEVPSFAVERTCLMLQIPLPKEF